MMLDKISFFLAGDAFQSRRLTVYEEAEDVKPLFDRVKAADVSFVNMEITIHAARAPLTLSKPRHAG